MDNAVAGVSTYLSGFPRIIRQVLDPSFSEEVLVCEGVLLAQEMATTARHLRDPNPVHQIRAGVPNVVVAGAVFPGLVSGALIDTLMSDGCPNRTGAVVSYKQVSFRRPVLVEVSQGLPYRIFAKGLRSRAHRGGVWAEVAWQLRVKVDEAFETKPSAEGVSVFCFK